MNPEITRSDIRRLVNVSRGLLLWFEGNGRSFPWRSSRSTAYEKVVVEVLLRRTRAGTVAAMYGDFFSMFPDWKSICSATGARLERVLTPLGLVNRRAGDLQKLACWMDKHGGVFPSGRKEIMELPSVGQYVASAVELFVHNRPRPLLDVNMARVLDRYLSLGERSDIRHDPRLHALAGRLVEGVDDPVRVNWAIIDLAATVCLRSKPLCKVCPLKRGCDHHGVTDK